MISFSLSMKPLSPLLTLLVLLPSLLVVSLFHTYCTMPSRQRRWSWALILRPLLVLSLTCSASAVHLVHFYSLLHLWVTILCYPLDTLSIRTRIRAGLLSSAQHSHFVPWWFQHTCRQSIPFGHLLAPLPNCHFWSSLLAESPTHCHGHSLVLVFTKKHSLAAFTAVGNPTLWLFGSFSFSFPLPSFFHFPWPAGKIMVTQAAFSEERSKFLISDDSVCSVHQTLPVRTSTQLAPSL